ncbi:DUF3302 domain-containing protein [Pararobbsia alpina]|uniref:DUF3302 domain-containing protein n=1 Tax=Pararobbsia alpina TaxID=621374 RepID=A0A6S7AYY9_9BURK|nr:DUF3302 domain-containing protein [Pararobbsia alpina]CAB3781585.1 hypothetical protein LMG28138_01251 [Pararobbsia alpina]
MTTPSLARRVFALACGLGAVLLPSVAQAGSTHPFEDGLANALSWVALTVMPLVGVYLFWKIHVLPEVIAEKRHHPQAEAIRVLCLLSLVFGGLLWPLAWLWAYMKPIEVPIVRSRRKRREREHEHAHEHARVARPMTGHTSLHDVAREDGVDARVLASERENAELRASLAALRAQLGDRPMPDTPASAEETSAPRASLPASNPPSDRRRP